MLASASPRRHALLRSAGLDFDVRVSGADEDLPPGIDPVEGARRLAERKARAAAASLLAEAPRWVVGADTIVAVPEAGGWRLLGKPADEAEADRMLRTLSRSTHRVVTGVCVLRTGGPGGAEALTGTETTRVTMRAIAPAERAAYVASGEWRGKAGGYSIQETADAFVTALQDGGFDNVVGLPVALTLELLRRARAPLPG